MIGHRCGDPSGSSILRRLARWLEKSLGGFSLTVAQDGSVALIRKGDQLVASLAPLVTCNEQLPALRLMDDDSAVRFGGDGVSLSLTATGQEITVSIESQLPCEGPAVRVVGQLRQGLFAGLEYLGKGELSSSRLDIETAEHIRFAPDPLKVTMPLMAFVTDRVSVAMTWDDMTLQPVYATPNFFDGADDHRMTLRGKAIRTTIRAGQRSAGGIDRLGREEERTPPSATFSANRRPTEKYLPDGTQRAAPDGQWLGALRPGKVGTTAFRGHGFDSLAIEWGSAAVRTLCPGRCACSQRHHLFCDGAHPAMARQSAAASAQLHCSAKSRRFVSVPRQIRPRTFRRYSQRCVSLCRQLDCWNSLTLRVTKRRWRPEFVRLTT